MEQDGRFQLDRLREAFRQQAEQREQLLLKYPPDPPNNSCYHALLKGMTIENSFEPFVGDYNLLFETNYEKIFIWTHSKDKNSSLISEVKKDVYDVPFWKSVGSIIQLSLSFCDAFELVSDSDTIDYKWIYYFEPKTTKVETADFYNVTELERQYIGDGRIIKATILSKMASIFDLLLKDDICYTALTLLLSAFQIHYCCLNCELSDHPWHDHLSHEPEKWEHSNYIPKLESAIVQSCRCAESILGEPPSRSNKNAMLRHREKWLHKTGINPNELFQKAEMSYLDFYYSLFFELRNPSAHSYGNIHFDLERKKAIQAQCFAAIVLREYIYTNEKQNENAIESLNFNMKLLDRVSERMSTSMTL